MKGLKTFLFGLAVAVASPTVEYIANVDWTQFGLSPTAGGIIGATIIGLRAATSTPIFKKG